MFKFCLNFVHHTVYIVQCTFLTIDRYNLPHCPSDSFTIEIYRGKELFEVLIGINSSNAYWVPFFFSRENVMISVSYPLRSLIC